MELDSKFGLHDYDVYICMRNQTKTTLNHEFVSKTHFNLMLTSIKLMHNVEQEGNRIRKLNLTIVSKKNIVGSLHFT